MEQKTRVFCQIDVQEFLSQDRWRGICMRDYEGWRLKKLNGKKNKNEIKTEE